MIPPNNKKRNSNSLILAVASIFTLAIITAAPSMATTAEGTTASTQPVTATTDNGSVMS